MISYKSLILVFSLIFLTTAVASGQQIERNTKEVYFDLGANQNASIKEWLVIGPFPGNLETDFLKSSGGEANIRPEEGMSLPAPDGKTDTWKRYRSPADIINLLEAVGKHENTVAYAACNLLSPKDQKLEVLLGSGDGVKVWLNGELIHSNPTERGTTQDEVRVPATLKKGVNRYHLKVGQVTGPWGFAARLVDYQGYLQSLKLADVSVKRNEGDILSIAARWMPKSAIWTLPPHPVSIEIRDETSRTLATLKSREEETVTWAVPEKVQGLISIIARHIDTSGMAREARFTCRAHSIVPVTTRQGHWETYDVTDGLACNMITSVVQDRNGILWFSLWDRGVGRYDGHTFQTFTKQHGLPSNDVKTVFEDSGGNLWFGAVDLLTLKGAGVCKYDGVTFKTFTTKDGLISDAILAIYEDKSGHLWFGYSFMQQGNVGGATRYDGKSFKHFTTKDGLASNGIMSITPDKQWNLWFGTNRGISKYDGKAFQNFTVSEGLVSNGILDVFQTKNGDVWIATWGGVSRYRDGKFQNFTIADGLASNEVYRITEDREGNLWFGTLGGLSRYDPSVESIPMEISGGLQDTKKNLWFSVSSVGLGRYDGKTLQTFAMEDGLPSNGVRTTYEDRQGNIWVGTFGGLVKYDGKRFQTFTMKDGLWSNNIRSIYEDRRGTLWIGTRSPLGGLCTYNGEKFLKVAGRQELGGDELWYIQVSYIIEDKNGKMWFAVPGGGLRQYDGKTFTKFTTENGLSNNESYQLMEDRKGNIWMATRDGACKYDGVNFRVYTTKDGLSENLIDYIFEDRGGNLWFGVTSGGIHKFDGRNFQIFTTEDGLLSNTASKIMEDENGNMIFITSGGVTIYTPPQQKIPPAVYVTQVVADKVYPVEPSEPTPFPSTGGEKGVGSEGFKIPSTAKHISFSYYGASYKTKRMRYNYMLEGHDKEWQGTWEEEAPYDNLKPGEYTFKVIAINRDLVYSETPATVRIQIVPPWYLNGWIVFPSGGGVLALAIASIFFGARYYAQRRESLRLQEQMLEQERHNRQILEAKNVQLQKAKEAADDASRAKSTFLANMSHEI